MHLKGVSEVAGIYFIGFPWLSKRRSGVIFGIERAHRTSPMPLSGKLRSRERPVPRLRLVLGDRVGARSGRWACHASNRPSSPVGTRQQLHQIVSQGSDGGMNWS